MAKRVNILAIETSSQACSIALQLGNDIHLSHVIKPFQHTQIILPMINELMLKHSIQFNELQALAFSCGPGSFTGVRIASSVVQALGFANSLPIIPISSLAILAHTAFKTYGWEQIMVSIDARMNQIYWALYRINNDTKDACLNLIGKEIMIAPSELESDTIHEINKNALKNWYGVGDGWVHYESQLVEKITIKPKEIDSSLYPNAQFMLELAKEKFNEGEWVLPHEALPTYLR